MLGNAQKRMKSGKYLTSAFSSGCMQLVGCLTPVGLGTFNLRAFPPLRCLLPGSREERRFILSFQVAESVGFGDDFRQWEDLLRIGD